jgi:hypothetical protein
MLLAVNAPKAFQRKLVDGADSSTTAAIDLISSCSFPLPAPAEQAKSTEARGEEWQGGGQRRLSD